MRAATATERLLFALMKACMHGKGLCPILAPSLCTPSCIMVVVEVVRGD